MSNQVVYTEIAEYSKLLTVIETIQASVPALEDGKLQTQVDLGCNFFAQAEVYAHTPPRTFSLSQLSRNFRRADISTNTKTSKPCNWL